MKKRSIMATALALVMSLACLTGCGQGAPLNNGTEIASGGVLVLSVNPEIAVEYDEEGIVTGITARNDDALAIIDSCEGLIGQQTRDAVTDLVVAIGGAGYFVEEVEGKTRQITLEIEAGSKLPHNEFLDEVIYNVRDCVGSNNWKTPLNVKNESGYGMSNYDDTDYGPGNDGVTDYNENDTDYGPQNDGVTDYNENDTDYGPQNDGVTDYNENDTDYGPQNDGVTNYDDTDYGPQNDGVTDYNDTDYGPNNDGVTDYDNGSSNYDDDSDNDSDDSDDGNSNYED